MKRIEYTGIALETLKDDAVNILKVWIPELAPFATGNPTDELQDMVEVENLAKDGSSVANVLAVAYVVCEYYGNSNITRPDVHTGEHVKIIVDGDNNDFYWDVIGMDDGLRAMEHRKFYISAKPDQLTALSDDTAYSIELDSRDTGKFISVHTSQGNSEAVGYDLLLDIDNSSLTIIDTEGNQLLLESLSKHWMLKNGNGDVIDMVPGKIESSTDTFIVNATSKVEFNTPLFQGNINSTKLSGTLQVGGAQTNGSTITSSGDTVAGGISLMTHKHTGNYGKPTSPPL